MKDNNKISNEEIDKIVEEELTDEAVDKLTDWVLQVKEESTHISDSTEWIDVFNKVYGDDK